MKTLKEFKVIAGKRDGLFVALSPDIPGFEATGLTEQEAVGKIQKQLQVLFGSK